MLRTMHRYQRHLGGIVLIGAIVLAMSGFGIKFIDGSDSRHERYAIKIDDTTIGHDRFYRERRAMDATYRRMFGKMYPQVAEELSAELSSKVREELIQRTLMTQLAARQGLYMDPAAERVRQEFSRVFPGGLDRETYRGYLSQLNMTAVEFESEVRDDALGNDLRLLASDVSAPSKAEAAALLKRSETRFGVDYAVAAPEKFVAKVPAPDAAALAAYYDEHKKEYTVPPRVSYDYAVIDADAVMNSVEIAQDDIEGYYVDHQKDFTNPAQARVRLLQLDLPKDAKADQISAVKTRAEELLSRAQAGEDFETIVRQNSSDPTATVNGGDFGWIDSTSTKLPKPVVQGIFKLKASGLSEVLEGPSGFFVAKIEEYTAPKEKELAEVQADIVTKLKAREAPGYAQAKAEDLYSSWSGSEKSLADLLTPAGFTMKSTGKLLSAKDDPDPALAGLTAAVMKLPEEEQKSMVRLGKANILVAVKERKDETVPPLDENKDKVLAAYKARESQKLAEEAAKKLLDAAKGKDLAAAASAQGFEVKHEKELSLVKNSGAFSDPAVQKILYSQSAAGAPLDKVFPYQGSFYVMQVTAVTPPTAETAKEKLPQYDSQAGQESEQMVLAALISDAEAKAKIDFDPNLMHR